MQVVCARHAEVDLSAHGPHHDGLHGGETPELEEEKGVGALVDRSRSRRNQ